MNVGHLFLYRPLISLLALFYRASGNLGIAIIILTLVIRLLLLPLTLPGMKAALKLQQLAPQLEKLKKKYAHDKQKLAQAQMSFYRQHQINPAAGCLPQIVQILVLITLYRVFSDILMKTDPAGIVAKMNALVYPFLRLPENTLVSRHFLYLDLAKPDLIFIQGKGIPGFFLCLAVVAQYLAAKLTLPTVEQEAKLAKKTVSASDDFSAMMQKQSLYLFPLMTFLFGFSFPSGLVLYWSIFSLFNLGQQWWLKKQIH